MKKFISGLIFGIIIATTLTTWAATTWRVELQKAPIVVNGKFWTPANDKPALSINGYTYLSVRDLSTALNIPIFYNGRVVIGYDIPAVEHKTTLTEKDIWKAGDLQISFLTNSYASTRVKKPYYESAFDVEIKNTGSADYALDLSHVFIDSDAQRIFMTSTGEELDKITLKPGEIISGTYLFYMISFTGPYAFIYVPDGNPYGDDIKYSFTYTNRNY